MNIKKILGIVAVVALVGGILYFNTANNQKDKEKVFTIKAIIPLTGSLSLYSTDLKKGLSVAQEEIDAKYGKVI